jgi:hypothetical protein
MEPDSAWLAALNAKESPVPVHAFWAGRDEIVSPPDSARLAGSPETCAPLAGHLTVMQQPEVLKKILSASEAHKTVAPAASAALPPQPEPPAPIVATPEPAPIVIIAPVEAAAAMAEPESAPSVVEAPVAAEEPVATHVTTDTARA